MSFGRTIAQTLLLLAIVIGCAWLYFYRLDFAPPNIQIDEAIIAINAQSIAASGRDLRGNLLPLYTQTADHSWYQPLVIYLTAIALKIAPFSEWSIRVPAVVMSVLSVGLMFLVVRRAMQSLFLAAVAAVMLALTPALFIHSRYAMDYHYPIPFILGWLYCLLRFDAGRQRAWLVGAAATLGVGFYCYISSIVMMPIYFVMTLMWLYARREAPRAYAVSTLTFGPLLLPFAIWIARHPTAYSATVVKYGLYDASDLNPVQGLRSAFGFLSVGERLSHYWNYFDPSLLFFGSGIKVQFSTNLVGVFLLPMAVFMLVGVYAVMKRRAEPFYLIVLIGFVTAPIAASIPTEENAIFRALGLLPFGVLLAAAGVERLWHRVAPPSLALGFKVVGAAAIAAGLAYATWALIVHHQLPASAVPLAIVGAALVIAGRRSHGVMTSRLAASALLLLLPLQFAGFWNDYFSSYRERVSFWLGGNIRGALEEVITRNAATGPSTVYFTPLKSTGGQLDWRNGFIDAYWRFYLLKHNRLDLLDRSRPVDGASLARVPPGSLMVANVENTDVAALVASGALRQVATIDELNGEPYFVVLEK
jgi:4-amino-4-deoxy-L-arabinose transferase-like glycosyltransferase